MKELGEISLRMVKILLENGSLEVLATNLSQTEFHTEEIKRIISYEVGIETAYETPKESVAIREFYRNKTYSVITRYIQHYISEQFRLKNIILDGEGEQERKKEKKK